MSSSKPATTQAYDDQDKFTATSVESRPIPSTEDSTSPTERTRLLPQEHVETTHHKDGRRSPASLVWLMLLVIVIISFADQIVESPHVRIMESVICYKYYETADPSKIKIGRQDIGPGAIGGVPEMLCKVGPVQGQLAELNGYQLFFDGIPALTLAVPFGWLADKYGRRPVFTLSVLSVTMAMAYVQIVLWFFLTFDIRLTWLSTLTSLFGGGAPVLTGLLYVMISDITTTAERGAVFLRFVAVNITAGLVMAPLAAWLMSYSPWIPALIGTFLYLISLVLFLCLPETLNYMHSSHETASPPPVIATEVVPVPLEPVAGSIPASSFASRLLLLAHQSTSFFTHDWRIPVLMIPFVAHFLLGQIGRLLLQYCSNRYGLTFSEATLLLMVFNGFKVILLAIVLPFVSKAIMKYLHISGQQKDLYLARASQVFVVVGWLFIGLAPNIPAVVIAMILASLGHGALTLLRSFITTLVPSHHIAKVYSVITMVDTLGSMFGAALLADLFRHGLAWGGPWIGAPFLLVGLASLLFLVLMLIVRLRKDEVDVHAEDGDDENIE